ncbi:MAG: hypothetical protein WCS27_13040 [Victivallaceae bacterium]
MKKSILILLIIIVGGTTYYFLFTSGEKNIKKRSSQEVVAKKIKPEKPDVIKTVAEIIGSSQNQLYDFKRAWNVVNRQWRDLPPEQVKKLVEFCALALLDETRKDNDRIRRFIIEQLMKTPEYREVAIDICFKYLESGKQKYSKDMRSILLDGIIGEWSNGKRLKPSFEKLKNYPEYWMRIYPFYYDHNAIISKVIQFKLGQYPDIKIVRFINNAISEITTREKKRWVKHLLDNIEKQLAQINTPQQRKFLIESLCVGNAMGDIALRLLSKIDFSQEPETVSLLCKALNASKNHAGRTRIISLLESVGSVPQVIDALKKVPDLPGIDKEAVKAANAALERGPGVVFEKKYHLNMKPHLNPHKPGNYKIYFSENPVKSLSFSKVMENDYGRPAGQTLRVYWFDAMRYCEKLTHLARKAGALPTGYEYRLPIYDEISLIELEKNTRHWIYGVDGGRYCCAENTGFITDRSSDLIYNEKFYVALAPALKPLSNYWKTYRQQLEGKKVTRELVFVRGLKKVNPWWYDIPAPAFVERAFHSSIRFFWDEDFGTLLRVPNVGRMQICVSARFDKCYATLWAPETKWFNRKAIVYSRGKFKLNINDMPSSHPYIYLYLSGIEELYNIRIINRGRISGDFGKNFKKACRSRFSGSSSAPENSFVPYKKLSSWLRSPIGAYFQKAVNSGNYFIRANVSVLEPLVTVGATTVKLPDGYSPYHRAFNSIIAMADWPDSGSLPTGIKKNPDLEVKILNTAEVVGSGVFVPLGLKKENMTLRFFADKNKLEMNEIKQRFGEPSKICKMGKLKLYCYGRMVFVEKTDRSAPELFYLLKTSSIPKEYRQRLRHLFVFKSFREMIKEANNNAFAFVFKTFHAPRVYSTRIVDFYRFTLASYIGHHLFSFVNYRYNDYYHHKKVVGRTHGKRVVRGKIIGGKHYTVGQRTVMETHYAPKIESYTHVAKKFTDYAKDRKKLAESFAFKAEDFRDVKANPSLEAGILDDKSVLENIFFVGWGTTDEKGKGKIFLFFDCDAGLSIEGISKKHGTPTHTFKKGELDVYCFGRVCVFKDTQTDKIHIIFFVK